MGGLSTTLLTSASALEVFNQALNTIGNNIDNADTPGFAKQEPSLAAQPFDPADNLAGGVIAGPLVNSRSEYLEQAVRTQTQLLGSAQQTATDLGQIQPLFNLTQTSGIDSSLNNFFNSFSALSVNPNDTISRQNVLTAAGQLAQSINGVANGIATVSTNVGTQTNNVVASINQIATQIAGINQSFQSDPGATQDEGLDAQMHTALDNLSQLTNYTVLKQSDGTYTVLIGGQTPLVMGNQAFAISSSVSSQTAILDSAGNDITSQITQGQLGALIQEQNSTIPGYMSALNTLASSLADTVNNQLSQGVDQNGDAPQTDLFTYDQDSDAASTLAVTDMTPDQIAAASADAPGGNGNAIAVANLASAPAVNGYTFTQAYGNLAAQVGSDVSSAQQAQTQYQDQLTQAQTQVTSQSGVSLNEEATNLLQFQQAYDAVGRLVSVLDSLTQTVINMVEPTT